MERTYIVPTIPFDGTRPSGMLLVGRFNCLLAKLKEKNRMRLW